MIPRMRSRSALRPWLLASLALAAAAPGLAPAAGADLEWTVRDMELRMEQERAQREMAQREFAQREALRGQEESIRRLEEARRRLETSTREVAELSTELGRSYPIWAPSITASAPPPSAVLGISVANEPRQDGAPVRTVSPGGPAEEAGIRAGDVIVSLDGTELAKQGDPGRALVDFMRQVEPDRKLRVGLLRDGTKMEVQVTARPTPPDMLPGALRQRFTGEPARAPRLVEQMRRNAQAAPGAGLRLDGMEFATVSSRLGRYFGVVSGVLVVRAGSGSPFQLQDGDVILSIDGRTPTTAQHAARILRSYQPGEKVKLRVQRDRKAIDIDTAAPRD